MLCDIINMSLFKDTEHIWFVTTSTFFAPNKTLHLFSFHKKVKKNAQGKFLALKEISFNNPAVGRTAKEKEKSIAGIISEITIVKEDLRHPNVVRYFRTFTDDKSEYTLLKFINLRPA